MALFSNLARFGFVLTTRREWRRVYPDPRWPPLRTTRAFRFDDMAHRTFDEQCTSFSVCLRECHLYLGIQWECGRSERKLWLCPLAPSRWSRRNGIADRYGICRLPGLLCWREYVWKYCGLRTSDGKSLWHTALSEHALQVIPALAENLVLLPLRDGSITALRAEDGSLRWHRPVNN